MTGLTAFPKVLGLVLLLSSCVPYTSAAAIAVASTESSRVVHPADITDSHVKPTEVVNLGSMIPAASVGQPIIPTINPDLVSWLERDRSSSTASGQSAASATTDMPSRTDSSPTTTASSEVAVSSADLITSTIATRWPDSLFDTNLPVPRPLTETPEYVVVTSTKKHSPKDPRTTQAISTSGAGVTTITSFAPEIEVMTTTIIKKPHYLPNPVPWLPLPTWMTKEKPKYETITWTKTHSSTAGATTATANLSSSGISSNTAKDSKTQELTVSYRNTTKTVTGTYYIFGFPPWAGPTTYTRTYTNVETLSVAQSKTMEADLYSDTGVTTITLFAPTVVEETAMTSFVTFTKTVGG